jgi:sugar lactone lactonase YvrE
MFDTTTFTRALSRRRLLRTAAGAAGSLALAGGLGSAAGAAPASRTSVLMEGLLLGECPRWHEGRLWFADWVAEKLYSVDETGNSRVEAEIASLPFSIDWLPDGRLLIVNARNNRLLRREADGSFVTHVDLAPLSPLGCNEIVVDGVGNAYVNNVNFDMPGGPVEGYMRYLEEPFAPGFIALVTPDGTARQVADGLAFPNGMAITPDNRTLIVAESYSGALTAFDIEADGSLTNRRLWAQLQRQGADGICIDAQGAVWASSGAGCLRVREGGAILDEITVEDGLMCFACMLGGADGNTLFIVANAWTGEIATSESQPTGKVLTARVGVRHAGFPSS